MKDIGQVAGELWQILGIRGEVDLNQVPRVLRYKGEIAYQGLGWLAREGKVNYVSRGQKTFVALTDIERNAFKEAIVLEKQS